MNERWLSYTIPRIPRIFRMSTYSKFKKLEINMPIFLPYEYIWDVMRGMRGIVIIYLL